MLPCAGYVPGLLSRDTGVLAFERRLGDERILVYLNFTNAIRPASFVLDADPKQTIMLLSNAGRREFHISQPTISSRSTRLKS